MTDTTIRKADLNVNRAPKGGAISPVNGLFYSGGQFMPMVAADKVWFLTKPAPLAGSVRQVAWANRLRTQALANLDDEISARRLFLDDRATAKEYRPIVKRFLIARHNLMTATSAASVIDRRAELA